MRSRRIALAGLAAVLAVSAVPMAQASTGDRDRDRMPDRWERSHGLSPRYDDSARDPDRDRLSNYREYRSGTDPRKRDRDGVRDAYEDSDDNGVRNRDERHGSHERHSDRDHRSDDRHESHDDHGDGEDHDDGLAKWGGGRLGRPPAAPSPR
jgi:hypothetical protein